MLLFVPSGLSATSRLRDTHPMTGWRHYEDNQIVAMCPSSPSNRDDRRCMPTPPPAATSYKKMALGNPRILPIVHHYTFLIHLSTTYHLSLLLHVVIRVD
jgi:hypothetical protein